MDSVTGYLLHGRVFQAAYRTQRKVIDKLPTQVLYLQNGVLLSIKNQQHPKIARQMDRTRKIHPESDNPKAERQTQYVPTHKWRPNKKQKISSLQCINLSQKQMEADAKIYN